MLSLHPPLECVVGIIKDNLCATMPIVGFSRYLNSVNAHFQFFCILFSQMANLKSSHDPMLPAKYCINILIFWSIFRGLKFHQSRSTEFKYLKENQLYSN